MYAEIELNNEIIQFINDTKKHNESFEEIKELTFTKEMMSKQMSASDMLNYSIIFQQIKTSAFNKVLNNQALNYPEGVVFERLLDKYLNNTEMSFEEKIESIKNGCQNATKNKTKITKLFEFLKGDKRQNG